jgi:hypothetical protein
MSYLRKIFCYKNAPLQNNKGATMIRSFIERKAYDWVFKNKRKKLDIIEKALENGGSPEAITQMFGGQQVILGALYLLAANHMVKMGWILRPCRTCGIPRTLDGNTLLECPNCGDCEKEM